tara:strand:+ start:1013 stop:1333 length:321 start_codon:yes stop_codon:yes gene_type:complete
MLNTVEVLKTLKRATEIQYELESGVAMAISLKSETDILYLASQRAIKDKDNEALNYIKERSIQVEKILKGLVEDKRRLLKEESHIKNSELMNKINSDNAMFNFSKN